MFNFQMKHLVELVENECLVSQIILRFFFSFLISSLVFLVGIVIQVKIWFAVIFLFMISGLKFSRHPDIWWCFALADVSQIWKGQIPQILRKVVQLLPHEIPKSWQEWKRKISEWIATKNIHFCQTLQEFVCQTCQIETKCLLYVSVCI